MIKNNEEASIILLTVMIIGVTMILITASAILISIQRESIEKEVENSQNYYLARAGLQKFLYYLEQEDMSNLKTFSELKEVEEDEIELLKKINLSAYENQIVSIEDYQANTIFVDQDYIYALRDQDKIYIWSK